MSSPSEWYGSLPQITRIWLTGAVASALLVRFEYASPTVFFVSWPAIIKNWQVRVRHRGAHCAVAGQRRGSDGEPDLAGRVRDERGARTPRGTAAMRRVITGLEPPFAACQLPSPELVWAPTGSGGTHLARLLQ